MTASFSSDAESTLHRVVCEEFQSQKRPSSFTVEEFYEINRCVQWISETRLKKVALQFPDHLLGDSVAIYQLLSKRCDATFAILADTSYASCCVDEVAVQHVDAEGMIHFGRSCLSPTDRSPVLYIFGRYPLEESVLCTEFKRLFPDRSSRVVVLYDVSYYYALDKIKSALSDYSNALISDLIIPNRNFGTTAAFHSSQTAQDENSSPHPSFLPLPPPNSRTFQEFGMTFTLPELNPSLRDYSIFFISDESSTSSSLSSTNATMTTNLTMMFQSSPFYTFFPSEGIARRESVDANKRLARRYYLVEKARDAKSIGLLVGTLGVSRHLDVIGRLKVLVRASGKRLYTFVIGKPNAAKLANFPEIDVFVMVACPQSTLLDSTDYYRPIITPFELELAIGGVSGYGLERRCVLDFRHLLPGSDLHSELAKCTGNKDEQETTMSLISGRMRRMHTSQPDNEETSKETKEISVRNPLDVAERTNISGGIGNRDWYGLEQRLGETAVTKAVEGSIGTSVSYSHEAAS